MAMAWRDSIFGLAGWWESEIDALLPSGQVHRRGGDAVVLLYEEHGVTAARVRGPRSDRLGRITFPRARGPADASMPVPVEDERIEAFLRAVERARGPVVLRLSNLMGATVRDVLPAEAEPELERILANKIDLLTPFSRGQVHMNARIVARRDDGKLVAALTVVPLRVLDEARARLAALGIEPDAIDLAGEDAFAAPDTVLEDLRASQRPRRLVRRYLLLCGLAILVAAGWAISEYHARQVTLDERRTFTRALEARLADVPELRARVEELRGRLSFVYGTARERPSPLIVLEGLSRLLPDDIWLEQLTLRGEAIRIDGFTSGDPGEVVRLIQGSPLFADADFAAPATSIRTVVDGSDVELTRFSVAAKANPVREPAP